MVLLQRKKGFKKSIDQDDARRRREEMQIQIRKNKREESVNQRRRIGKWSRKGNKPGLYSLVPFSEEEQ